MAGSRAWLCWITSTAVSYTHLDVYKRQDVNLAHNTPSPLFRFGISFNKLFDYLAAGKPVLSDFPCPYNPAVAYGAGLDVQHPDDASVARRVEEMAAMGPEERDKLSRNALRAAHDYDFKKRTEKLLDVIEHPVTAVSYTHLHYPCAWSGT